jgi:hypothetical protein
MHVSLWDELVYSFPTDDPKYEELYGLQLWLSGVGKVPGRNCQCSGRSALMWKLRKYAIAKSWIQPRVLLIGNGSTLLNQDDVEYYDEIVVFNRCKHSDVIPYITQHALRPNPIHGRFNGTDTASLHAAPVLLVDASDELVEQYRHEVFTNKECSCISSKDLGLNYPEGKVASTGYIVLRHFLKQGALVTLKGFAWKGLPDHDWDFEHQQCQDLISQRKVSLQPYIPPDTLTNIAHYVWLDYQNDGTTYTLKTQDYVSIKTFMHHHPGWQHWLWTNTVVQGSLFEELKSKGLVVKPMSLGDIPPHIGTRWPTQKSDWTKFILLYRYGGVSVDVSDTITVRPFDDYLKRAHKLTLAKDKLKTEITRTGFIMINRAHDEFIKEFCDRVSDPNYDSNLHRIATESTLRTMVTVSPIRCNPFLPYSTVYPIPPSEMDDVILGNEINHVILPDTIQIHWYGGSGGGSPSWISTQALSPETLMTGDTLYHKCVQYALSQKVLSP